MKELWRVFKIELFHNMLGWHDGFGKPNKFINTCSGCRKSVRCISGKWVVIKGKQ